MPIILEKVSGQVIAGMATYAEQLRYDETTQGRIVKYFRTHNNQQFAKSTIARDLNVSESYVTRVATDLLRSGYLTTTKGFRNVYFWHWHSTPVEPSERTAPRRYRTAKNKRSMAARESTERRLQTINDNARQALQDARAKFAGAVEDKVWEFIQAHPDSSTIKVMRQFLKSL